MKKLLSVMAVSAVVLTASTVSAGGPGKKMDVGCPAACQQQFDDFNASQAQQNEQLGGHGQQLKNHEGRITTLEKDAFDPWYGRVGVRAAWMTQDINVPSGSSTEADSKTGFGGALAFGRQFGQFRTELEVADQGADLKNFSIPIGIIWDGEVNVMTVMANGYYEIPVATHCAVYGMAGLGYAKYDLTVDRIDVTPRIRVRDVSENSLAYKAGVGATYNFAGNMDADIGYEYLGIADNNVAESINGHNVVASFRYKF